MQHWIALRKHSQFTALKVEHYENVMKPRPSNEFKKLTRDVLWGVLGVPILKCGPLESLRNQFTPYLVNPSVALHSFCAVAVHYFSGMLGEFQLVRSGCSSRWWATWLELSVARWVSQQWSPSATRMVLSVGSVFVFWKFNHQTNICSNNCCCVHS